MANKEVGVKNNNDNIIKLKEIDGIKFRIMWSTRILYLFLGMTVSLLITFQIGYLLEYGSMITDYDELVPLVVMSVIVLLFLNYFNRKFLGKIVAVINENGIYTKNGVISWNNIKEIKYNTPIPLTRSSDIYEIYCSLTVSTDDNEYKILHAPKKMIKYIKRYVPNVKVKRDSELILIILISLVLAILIPIAYHFNLFD